MDQFGDKKDFWFLRLFSAGFSHGLDLFACRFSCPSLLLKEWAPHQLSLNTPYFRHGYFLFGKYKSRKPATSSAAF